MTIDEFRDSVKRWGTARTLAVCLLLGLRKYAGIEVCRVFARDCVPSPSPIDGPDGINLRVANSGELLHAAEDPELELDDQFVLEAQARGDMAFAAFDGDNLVSYTWRAFSRAPYVGDLWVKVAPPYHYAYKALTKRSHRGRRILPALARLADSRCAQHGYTGLVLYVDISNPASLNAEKFLGSRAVGYAGHVNWLGHRIPFRTPSVARIGFAFERAGRTPNPGSSLGKLG